MIWNGWVWGCVQRGSPSEEVGTRDLDLTVDIRDEGDGMRLTALAQGPLGPVIFTGADELTVLARGEALPLEPDEDGLYGAPLGDFSGTLTVSLEREVDHAVSFSAPVLPDPGLLVEADAERLSLAWQRAQGEHEITLSVRGDCVEPLWRQLEVDTGYYSLSRAEIWTSGACGLEVELLVQLWSSGGLVQGLEGGSYQVSSMRSGTVEVAWGS